MAKELETLIPDGGVYTIRGGEQTHAIGDAGTQAVLVRQVGGVFPQGVGERKERS